PTRITYYAFPLTADHSGLPSFPTRRSSDLVARPGHELLEVHRVVAEHGARFASRRLDERRQLARRFHHADAAPAAPPPGLNHERSEEHTSELQSRFDLVCRLLLAKKTNRKR